MSKISIPGPNNELIEVEHVQPIQIPPLLTEEELESSSSTKTTNIFDVVQL